MYTLKNTLAKGTFFLLGYIGLLIIVPTAFAPDATLPNVASRFGYNTQVAYLVIAIWSLVGLGVFAYIGRPALPDAGRSRAGTDPLHAPSIPSGYLLRSPWLECLVVGALTALLYWPPFLVRYGTYIEDTYFVNALWRMQCGQLPYRDFEFLYGPLMLYPSHYWMKLVGYSLQNYYWLVAVLQGAAMAFSLRLFQSQIPDFRTRWVAFVLFAAFIFDTLLGFNYIAWRILLIVVALAIAAREPTKTLGLISGSLIGAQLAYSFDYGIVAFIALAAVYVSSALNASKSRWLNRPAVETLVIFIVTTCATSLIVSLWLTGDTFYDFTSSISHALLYASAKGLGNFRFYWTVNSIALFGLLAFAIIAVGGGLPYVRRQTLTPGDRFLLGALLFAVGGLKIAIQRADVWHITLPFIPLVAALLWRSPKNVFTIDKSGERIVWTLLIVAAVTRCIGLLPTASYFISGVAQGARDHISATKPLSETRTVPAHFRRYSLQSELSRPDPDIAALARYLADPVRLDRPVLFYGDLWGLGASAGVCPAGYSFYKLMYTDEFRPTIKELERRKNTLVVMEARTYQQLLGGKPPTSDSAPLTVTKQLASWLSSTHYGQKLPEEQVRFSIWKRNVGDYLLRNYQRGEMIGDMIVLERKHNTTDQIP